MPTRTQLTWTSVAVLAFGAITVLAILALLVPRSSAQARLAGTVLHARKAPHFHLTDQFGREITLAQLRGRPVVLTFMESRCRQLCPLTAETISQTLRTFGAKQRAIAALAISTNPEGDTPKAVREFSLRHGLYRRWHYLTGTRAELDPIWRSYFVYVPGPSAPAAIRDSHTSATYLIDRQGRERVLMAGVPDIGALRRDLLILSGSSPGQLKPAAIAPEADRLAPGFKTDAVSGGKIALNYLRGKVILLNFWATWCKPCRSEMPLLQSWFRRWEQRGVAVVGIDQEEDRPTVDAYLHHMHVHYPLVLDPDGVISARYHVIGLPTTFLIDQTGVIRSIRIGMVDDRYLKRHVTPLIEAHLRG